MHVYIWYPDKIPPGKIPPEKFLPKKIPLNVVEREPVPTRVLNLNSSEASYKPKQRSYRKVKLKKNIFILLFFFGGILVGGDFIREPYIYVILI